MNNTIEHPIQGVDLLNKSDLFEESEQDSWQYVKAHILKASIARITGLVNLLDKRDDQYKNEIIHKLQIEIKELEKSVNDIKNAFKCDFD